MNWSRFLAEGETAVRIVRDGLRRRGISAGDSILTSFNTDEDIPVYNGYGNKLFWISVKAVSGSIYDPVRQMPPNYKGWMCGEVESKQWVNPPDVIIWYCLRTNVAWGAIVPNSQTHVKNTSGCAGSLRLCSCTLEGGSSRVAAQNKKYL